MTGTGTEIEWTALDSHFVFYLFQIKMVSSQRIIIGVCLAFMLLIKGGASQIKSDKLNVHNSCASKTTCRDCIQTKSCAWCMDPKFGDKPRCFQPSMTPFAGMCSEEYTYDPSNEQEMKLTRELTRSGSSVSGGGAYGSGSYSESSYSSSSSFSSSSSSHSFGSSSGGSSSGSFSASGQESIVQISPQRVGLKLRISECDDW